VTTVTETPEDEERVARLHRQAAASYATGKDARDALTRAAKAKAAEDAERKAGG
jgi:hypothetical protein